MSIPIRTCPQCAGALDGQGNCRACAPAGAASEALVAQAEALYASYLAARIVRAQRALKIAKVELLRDPRNRDKADGARAAEEEAQRLQAQLVAHTRGRAEARQTGPVGGIEIAGAPAEPAPLSQESAHMADAPGMEPGIERIGMQAPTRQEDRQCPRCDAQAPGSIGQCRCGYMFEAAKGGFPPHFLTVAELAALRSSGRRR